MATTVTIEHDFPFRVDTYIERFFSAELERYIASSGRYTQYKTDSIERGTEHIQRILQFSPKGREIPGWLSRAVGIREPPSMRELADCRPGQGMIDIELVPSALSDRICIKGQLKLSPRGDRGCRQDVRMDVSVSVRGLGGRIESRMVQTLKQKYAQDRQAMLDCFCRSPRAAPALRSKLG